MPRGRSLTTAQIADIKRRLYDTDESQNSIARRYGVSQAVISQIQRNKAYQDIRPVPPVYDPTIATDPVTLETVFIKPDPKPLPRWDGATMQKSQRAIRISSEGEGLRPCLTARSNWIGCPYPGSSTLCAATEKVINGNAVWLHCILTPGIHKVPEGYYPPKPKVERIIADAKHSETERRRTHTKAITVQKAASKREPKQAPLPKALRMRQYRNGVWVTRNFLNGEWIDEPIDREVAQPGA